jgi:hypothetical protein
VGAEIEIKTGERTQPRFSLKRIQKDQNISRKGAKGAKKNRILGAFGIICVMLNESEASAFHQRNENQILRRKAPQNDTREYGGC